MSKENWNYGSRRGSYEDYDHSDEEMYVYDQCCDNCRFFRNNECVRPERDEFDYPGPKDWCELWAERDRRSRG